MKWKTIVVTAVIGLLVATLAVIGWRSRTNYAIQTRIGQYKLMKEEQQLITDILNLKYEAALIKAKFNPAPTTAPPKAEE